MRSGDEDGKVGMAAVCGCAASGRLRKFLAGAQQYEHQQRHLHLELHNREQW
jgi:hypothetical protein